MPTDQSDVVERLQERARAARDEGNSTALGDALHFEESAAEILRLRTALAAETERCARVAERDTVLRCECCRDTALAIAAAIRARG